MQNSQITLFCHKKQYLIFCLVHTQLWLLIYLSMTWISLSKKRHDLLHCFLHIILLCSCPDFEMPGSFLTCSTAKTLDVKTTCKEILMIQKWEFQIYVFLKISHSPLGTGGKHFRFCIHIMLGPHTLTYLLIFKTFSSRRTQYMCCIFDTYCLKYFLQGFFNCALFEIFTMRTTQNCFLKNIYIFIHIFDFVCNYLL